MSSGFSQGFAENQRPSSKVLRPPGGGSSDIFGADTTTPRTIRNHMASNIFGSTQEGPVKNNGDGRRSGRDGDSYNRLFGGSERPYTPAKNHLKSNIPLGGDGSAAKATNGNAVAATNGHTNGKAENNNANAAGQQNGTSKTEIEASPKDPASGDSIQAQSAQNENSYHISPSEISKNENKTSSTSKVNSQSTGEDQSKVISTTTSIETPTGEAQETDKLSIAANKNSGADTTDNANITSSKHAIQNGEINGNYPDDDGNHANDAGNSDKSSSKDGETSSTTTSSVVSPISGVSNCTDQSNKSTLSSASASLRSPRALTGVRNPVTGVGIEMPLYKKTRVLRKDGNPVTGEGYNGVDASASVNGAKHVINKNRIPPGGYSSGLW